MTLFLLDANILITAQNTYYPIKRVPEFWGWLLHQADAGRVKMPVEILDEVKGGTKDAEKDALFAWLQGDGILPTLRLDEAVNPALVAQVLAGGYAPDLNDVELDKIGKDPFLVAYALADSANRCVVTAEIPKPGALRSKRKVPDVCDTFGQAHCNAFGLIHHLDFKTNWKG